MDKLDAQDDHADADSDAAAVAMPDATAKEGGVLQLDPAEAEDLGARECLGYCLSCYA